MNFFANSIFILTMHLLLQLVIAFAALNFK